MAREHLLVLPDRAAAADVADELMHDGFAEVRVLRETLVGEDDAHAHADADADADEWAVHVITRDDDTSPTSSARLRRCTVGATTQTREARCEHGALEVTIDACDP